MKFFDVIYSVNVFQHCSQKDRFEYFQQGYDVLKKGGYFLFTEFLMTEENRNNPYWGIIDENGRGYTQFFNQLTECDWDYELYELLNNVGFKPIKCSINGNFCTIIMQKK
jgi:SAM-dependent methyltransferase